MKRAAGLPHVDTPWRPPTLTYLEAYLYYDGPLIWLEQGEDGSLWHAEVIHDRWDERGHWHRVTRRVRLPGDVTRRALGELYARALDGEAPDDARAQAMIDALLARHRGGWIETHEGVALPAPTPAGVHYRRIEHPHTPLSPGTPL